MPELEIHLFGYPEFLIDGCPLQFERRKTAALLVYLAAETSPTGAHPTGISRDALAALFWPDCSQEQAGAYIRQSLWEFTRLAGETWIIRRSGMIALDFASTIHVDTHAFETLYQQWKNHANHIRVPDSCLNELVSLYRGEFTSGFSLKNCPDFDHWQLLQAESLHIRQQQALEAITQWHTAQGEYFLAETHARQWLALDPLNESAYRALMLIFAQSGRHNAALQQFETCRAVLQDELGIEPDSQTHALYTQIRQRHFTAPDSTDDLSQAHTREETVQRPSGTVTFVFTDIQGSTQLWEHQKDAMQHAFRRQEEIVRGAMLSHGGFVYKMIGDAFQVAFSTAKGALLAALEAQKNLHSESWAGNITELKVRMALHTGVTDERADDYVGPVLNRVARLLSAGHGGQVLLTQATYQLVREELPAGISLRYLGEFHLKDLVQPEQVYQVTAPGMSSDFPPLKAEGVRSLKLPSQSTPFIGRESELNRIGLMLNDPGCRIVTLLGIGGSGKTRLAVRAAEESQGFKDGVRFCALENVETIQGLILAIAEAVELTLIAAPGSLITLDIARGQLFQFLAGKQILLILDNFEQLSIHAGLVDELLSAAPEIKAIITSRERLNLHGEWVLEIGGLAFPGDKPAQSLESYAAIQLFIQTAQRNSSFHPQPEDWPAIVRTCQLLEGIPLALEMAAAWTRTLTCDEIAEEIERNQDFLVTSWRGMPERHQTLRAVFEHSWRLLNPAEQTAFTKISIFLDGFTREAARVVADVPLPLISALIDKALIRRVSSGRFEIHPLLRRYAAEKLNSDRALFDLTRSLKADYDTDWLVRMFEKMKGKEHLTSLIALRSEAANLASSMEWLVEQVDVERLSRILPAWILYHVMNDRHFEMQEDSLLVIELVNQLRPRIKTPDMLDAVLLALACAAVRYFCIDYSNPAQTKPYQQESMQLIHNLPDHVNKAYALLLNCTGPGILTPTEAIEYSHQCIQIFEKLGEPWGAALTRMIMGDINLFSVGSIIDARVNYTGALKDFTYLGSDWGRGLCIAGLMSLEGSAGNLEEAHQLGLTCLSIFSEMGSSERMVQVRRGLAEIAVKRGCTQDARGLYQANLEHFIQRGDEGAQKYYRDMLKRVK